MSGPKPGVRPRPMGGFNQGMGNSSEHLDEAAVKAASKQKQLNQKQSSTDPASGKSGTNPLLPQTDAKSEKSREVGSIKDELVKRPLKDIEKGLASFFDLNALFNVDVKDTPEEQAKKKSLHQRFQKLTEEQKTVAQKKYQEEMQKKKTEQEEEQQKKEEEEAREKATIAPPSSPKKGPVGPFWGQSKKQKTQTMLQQSRQGLGQVGKKY